MDGIRIVTINTWKGDGPYHRRMHLLARQLAELAPDIVACQEAFVSEEAGADTPRLLAEELGMNLFFSPAREKVRVFEGREVRSVSGMALLSRRPWQTRESIPVPSDRRDGERVAQVGAMELAGVLLTIANLHLTHLADADELRRRQLATVLHHSSVAGGVGPILVCGDFNTTFDGPVIGPLLADSSCVNIRDAWAAGGGTGPRGTLVGRAAPGPCIDYILSMALDGRRHPRFTSSRLALDMPAEPGGILPSDHFAVTTILHPDQPELVTTS